MESLDIERFAENSGAKQEVYSNQDPYSMKFKESNLSSFGQTKISLEALRQNLASADPSNHRGGNLDPLAVLERSKEFRRQFEESLDKLRRKS